MSQNSATSTPVEASLPPSSQHPTKRQGRQNWPIWMKQLPILRFEAIPDSSFELVKSNILKDLEAEYPDDIKILKADIEFANSEEVLLEFIKIDHQARYQQNRFYLYQIWFIGLATAAAIIGALQALTLSNNPNIVPLLGFFEGLVAISTVAIATRQGDSPLPVWIRNRRIAERLRREYFRFLMDLPPYEGLEVVARKNLFGERVNTVVSDEFADEPSVLEAEGTK